MINGIDVSHLDGEIDWKQVAGSSLKPKFAFVKCSQGTRFTDPRLAHNVLGATNAGLQIGVYHFVHLDEPGADQACFVFDVLAKAQISLPTLPIVLDLEDDPAMPGLASHVGKDAIRRLVGAFSAAVQKKTFKLPMLYGSPAWLDEWVGDGFGGHPLWIAEYGVQSPRLPQGWAHWNCWQRSSAGRVPGIRGDVDINVWGGALPGVVK